MTDGSLSPVLELRGIHKQFGSIQVLRDVRLNLYPGEIHALMGQNGAGKSTLIKVLTGVLPSSGGEMFLDGQLIQPHSPLDAQKLGISTVYQEVNLCPNLSVAENVFAGRYPRCGAAQGFRIDWAAVNRRAEELLGRIGLDIDVTRLLSGYSVAVQQMVAIARPCASSRCATRQSRLSSDSARRRCSPPPRGWGRGSPPGRPC